MDAHGIGTFTAVFFMFCLFSFLYRDNPFYKFAEHVFIGLSIGYWVTLQYHDVLVPKLYHKLVNNPDPVLWWGWYLIPALLCLMMFARYIKSIAWLGRVPIAFVVGAYAGLNAQAYARGVLIPQTRATIQPLLGRTGASDAADICLEAIEQAGWFVEMRCRYGQQMDAFLILLGVCSALLYFFFSAPRRRVLGAISTVGIIFLMLAFGASFGFTVMGRVALAVGRAQFALEAPVASLVSLALIIVGLVVWSQTLPDSPEPSMTPNSDAP